MTDSMSEFLRQGAETRQDVHGLVAVRPELLTSAADEIERLRDRLDRAFSYREAMENLPEGTIPRD